MNCHGFRKNIDAYLKDSLSASRLEEFEAHYFKCDRCFNALRIHKALRTRNFLLRENRNQRSFKRHYAFIAAASILLIIGLGLTMNQVIRQNSLHRISAFTPPVFLISETRGTAPSQAYTAAVEAYSRADFTDSLQHAESIPERERTPKILFLIGIDRLITGDKQGAIVSFQRIIDQMDPSYFDEALFFKGIALLRCGKIDEAEALFTRISEMFSPMKDKATERLLQISSIR